MNGLGRAQALVGRQFALDALRLGALQIQVVQAPQRFGAQRRIAGIQVEEAPIAVHGLVGVDSLRRLGADVDLLALEILDGRRLLVRCRGGGRRRRKRPNSPWRPRPLRASMRFRARGSWLRLGLLAGRGLVVDRGQFEARLNLVGLDALLLALELVDRESLQDSDSAARTAPPDAAAVGPCARGSPRPASANSPVLVGTPARACLTSTARFCVSRSEASSSLTERRSFQSLRLEALRQSPVHDSLHRGGASRASPPDPDRPDAPRDNPRCASAAPRSVAPPGVPSAATSLRLFDFVDPRLEVDALPGQCIEIGRRHHRIGLRHALVVGLAGGCRACCRMRDTSSRQSSRLRLMKLSSR